MRYLVKFAASSMLPSADGVPGAADTGIDRFVDDMMDTAPFLYALGLVGGGLLFYISPLLTIGIPLPAGLLSKKALDRHAYGFATSRITLLRQMSVLLKMVAGFSWGVHDDIRARHALAPLPPDPGTWRSE